MERIWWRESYKNMEGGDFFCAHQHPQKVLSGRWEVVKFPVATVLAWLRSQVSEERLRLFFSTVQTLLEPLPWSLGWVPRGRQRNRHNPWCRQTETQNTNSSSCLLAARPSHALSHLTLTKTSVRPLRPGSHSVSLEGGVYHSNKAKGGNYPSIGALGVPRRGHSNAGGVIIL